MFCNNCGTQNEDGSAFCMNCGTKLEAAPQPAQNTQQAAPAPQQQPQQAAQPQPAQPQVNQAPQQPTNVQAPVQEGPLSAAWNDVKSTPHWFKKILFMGLCNLIPFMSFGTIGFAQQWGADVAAGKRETMPNKVFSNKTFLSGLFEYILWTAYGFVFGVGAFVISMLFFLVPVLNIIIGIAVFVFTFIWNSFVAMAVMRSTVGGDLGKGFRVKEVFPIMKRKFGAAFCAYFLPSILCGLITAGIVLVLVLIFGAILGVSSCSTMNAVQSSSNPFTAANDVIGAVTAMAGIGLAMLIIGILACCFVAFFMGVLEKILRYRAIGHWIATYAPEWAEERKAHMADKQ